MFDTYYELNLVLLTFEKFHILHKVYGYYKVFNLRNWQYNKSIEHIFFTTDASKS